MPHNTRSSNRVQEFTAKVAAAATTIAMNAAAADRLLAGDDEDEIPVSFPPINNNVMDASSENDFHQHHQHSPQSVSSDGNDDVTAVVMGNVEEDAESKSLENFNDEFDAENTGTHDGDVDEEGGSESPGGDNPRPKAGKFRVIE